MLGLPVRRGPFVNENGDIWVPVTVGGIVAARRIAAEAAHDGVRFVDMEEPTMSIHGWYEMHSDEDPVDDCPDSTPALPCTWTGRAYHFREVDE